MINSRDGRFCLECWFDEESEEEPDMVEFSDDLRELTDRMNAVVKAGRFEFIQLSRWEGFDSDDEECWSVLEEWSCDDE
jgi:hypothetical protein